MREREELAADFSPLYRRVFGFDSWEEVSRD